MRLIDVDAALQQLIAVRNKAARECDKETARIAGDMVRSIDTAEVVMDVRKGGEILFCRPGLHARWTTEPIACGALMVRDDDH